MEEKQNFPNVLTLSYEQCQCLKENFLKIRKYYLTGKSEYSDFTKFCKGVLGISQNTFKSIVADEPQRRRNLKTLEDISQKLGRELKTEISVSDLYTRELVFDSFSESLNFPHEILKDSNELAFYEGIYYTYSFSKRTQDPELNFGVLSIWAEGEEYVAELLYGIRNMRMFHEIFDISEDTTDLSKHRRVLTEVVRKRGLKEIFEEKRQDYTALRCYTGKILPYQNTLVLMLNPYKHPEEYLKMITISRPKKTGENHYRGGIHTVLTTEHEVSGSCSNCETVQYLASSGKMIMDLEKIQEYLTFSVLTRQMQSTDDTYGKFYNVRESHPEVVRLHDLQWCPDRLWYLYIKHEWKWDAGEYPDKLTP